jgi:DNA-binding LacI/PurR family transcriptional regulator
LAFTEEINARLLAAIAEALAPTGLALTLVSSTVRDNVVAARDVQMDGALIYSCHSADESVAWLKKRGLPIVFIDQAPMKGYASINIDDRGGARAAAQHVIDFGHRDIAIVTTAADVPTDVVVRGRVRSDNHVADQRIMGWLDALDEAGVAPRVVNSAGTTVEAGTAAAGLLLNGDEPRPTAVLCFCDTLAVGVVRHAQRASIDVPGDLSVVGFDDTALAQHTQPPLTTVRQDVAAKGRAAGAAIVNAITAPTNVPRPRIRRLVVPTELVVRESTGPAR